MSWLKRRQVSSGESVAGLTSDLFVRACAAVCLAYHFASCPCVRPSRLLLECNVRQEGDAEPAVSRFHRWLQAKRPLSRTRKSSLILFFVKKDSNLCDKMDALRIEQVAQKQESRDSSLAEYFTSAK